MKRTLCMILALAPLAACMNAKTSEPITIYKTVNVPVAADCVPEALGPAPDYGDTEQSLRAAENAAGRYRLLAEGREQRMGRLAQLEPIIDACRGSHTPPTTVAKPTP